MWLAANELGGTARSAALQHALLLEALAAPLSVFAEPAPASQHPAASMPERNRLGWPALMAWQESPALGQQRG
mgnify:CR=1 FL=1